MTGPQPFDAANMADGQRWALAALVKVFQAWLHLPDLDGLDATLGAVAANRVPGDPVWLLLVGPPSSGKTELAGSLAKLPDVRFAALLTEAALLSGTARKERAKGAKGGLLREIGSFGILIMKDFTSTLAQHRDARAAALAALREIFDGHWSRPVGSDGGQVLHWRGKLGLVAGCTPAIDTRPGGAGVPGVGGAGRRTADAAVAVVTRWPPRRYPPPVEPPAWVRVFDPEAWRDDAADAQVMAGLLEHGLRERWEISRDWHAECRWVQAVNDWYRAHPGSDRRLEELFARRARRRG